MAEKNNSKRLIHQTTRRSRTYFNNAMAASAIFGAVRPCFS